MAGLVRMVVPCAVETRVKSFCSLKWRWIIDGHSKLIIPNKANQPDDITELDDLKADPTEEKNFASEQAPKVTEMTAKLDVWWKP